MAGLLLVALLADPVADAKALRDERGVAAFEEILALAAAAQAGRERQGILDVLVSLGPAAVPLVVAKTQEKSPPARVRECAFMSLQKLAGRDEAATAVVPLLVHSDGAVRRVVRDALKREAAIPLLLAALRDADAGLRNELRAVLRAQGAALRPHLAPLLEDEDADFLKQLVPLLAGAGDLETLVAWTRDRPFAVRIQAVMELGRHLEAPAQVVPALRRALADPDGHVRLVAVRGLARFPAQAGEFAEDVYRLVLRGSGRFGAEAARTLLAVGDAGRPFLERALQSPDKDVRLRTVRALAEGGEDVVPLLERAAGEDASPSVRGVAVEALGRWPRSLPTLERALDDSDSRVRAAALEALGRLGPKAAPAAPAVAKLVAGRGHRRAAFEALAVMGPRALPAFLDVVLDLPPDQARQGHRLWGAETTVPALAKLLADPPAARRRAAAWALGVFGADAASAVPELARALDDKDRFVAGQAAWALGEIGKAAKPALPALKAKLKDPALRPIVRVALRRIEEAG